MNETSSDPYSLFVYALNSPVSRERYTTRLRWFFSHIGLSEGSVEERCRIFVTKAQSNNNWAFQNLLKFLNMYKERYDRREVTGATIRNYVKAVKLFCEMNDIVLPWKKITRGLPKGRKWADDRAPTLEEIRMLVEYPDRRIRAIVTTMISSGIRVGAWTYLKVGHLSPLMKNGKLVAGRLIVYAGEEEQYVTFITPEAYGALHEWLDYRKRSGEKITPESWMMRNLWDSRVARGRGLVSVPVQLRSSGVKALMENALWTQGLRTKLPPGKRRHEFQTDHGLRKFYKSRCEQVMKPANVEVLMDHTIGIGDSYYRPTENDLLEDYLKAVNLLTINEENRLQMKVDELATRMTSEEVVRTRREQEKDQQIEFLTRKQERFEKLIQMLIDSGQLIPPAE